MLTLNSKYRTKLPHFSYDNYCVLYYALQHNARLLVNDQRDAQIHFYVFISIYNSLHVSSTSCPKHVDSYKQK